MEVGSSPQHRIIITLDDQRMSGKCDWRCIAKVTAILDIISSFTQFVFALILLLVYFSLLEKEDHRNALKEALKLGGPLVIAIFVWTIAELLFACVLLIATGENCVRAHRGGCLVMVIVWLIWILIGTCFHGWVALKVMDMDESRTTTTVIQMVMFCAVIPYCHELRKSPPEELDLEEDEIIEGENSLGVDAAVLERIKTEAGKAKAARISIASDVSTISSVDDADEEDDTKSVPTGTDVDDTEKEPELQEDRVESVKKKKRRSSMVSRRRSSTIGEVGMKGPTTLKARRSSVAASEVKAARRESVVSTVSKVKARRESVVSEAKAKRRGSVASSFKGRRRNTITVEDDDKLDKAEKNKDANNKS